MNSSDIKKETKSNLGVQRKPSLHHFSLEYGKVTTDPLGYQDIHKYVKYIFFSVALSRLSYNNSEKKNPPFQALQKSLIYMSYE